MIRLFVALNIPDEVKNNIIELREKIWSDKKIKWESPNKFHLTLKFIGEVEETLLEDLMESISFVENYPIQTLSFNKFGFFFKDNQARILWAGFEVQNDLLEISNKLNDELNRFGIKKENRKFKAHLTLLRIKQSISIDFINSFKNFRFEKVNFQSNSVSLIKSELDSKGSTYSEIKKYNLKHWRADERR